MEDEAGVELELGEALERRLGLLEVVGVDGGLPAGYFHLPPAVYTDDLEQAEASLERLTEFEFDAGLVFHGSSVLSNADEKLEAYVYRG